MIQRNEDPYNIVRKYVDFIQDKKFNDLMTLICNERYKKNINKALLLERWAIFCTFYIYLDRRMIDKKMIIKKFADCVFQNISLIIVLLELEIGQLDTSKSQ